MSFCFCFVSVFSKTRQQKESVSRFTCQMWGYCLAFFVTLQNLWLPITWPVGSNGTWNHCYLLAKYVFLPISSAESRKSDNETHLLHMSWYVYLWYIWWFLLRIFGGIFWGNFLTCNLLTIAHNARWRHFSPIRIFPEFFDFDLSISGLDFFCDRDLTFSCQIIAS